MERQTYRVAEVAQALGVSRQKIYEEIRRKRIKAVRLGATVLIPVNELRRLTQ
jgi:excisionase family DNA binding protein